MILSASRMAKVVITAPDYFSPESKRLLRRVGEIDQRYFSPDELAVAVADCEVLCVRVETRVDRDLLERAPALRVVLSGTTGINHVDTSRLAQNGVELFHLHGEHTRPTAEHAFALLTSLARNLRGAHEALMAGEWARHRFIGRELQGLALGIVGIGKIGTEVSRLAGAFGMRVLAYDPYLDAGEIHRRGALKVEELEELFERASAVALHCPLTDETAEMVDAAVLTLLEDGGYLVNAARGGIVVEGDLVREIATGRISAAVDVFDPEPPGDSALIRCARSCANLIVTPHLGASTRQAVERASEGLARQALHHLGIALDEAGSESP